MQGNSYGAGFPAFRIVNGALADHILFNLGSRLAEIGVIGGSDQFQFRAVRPRIGEDAEVNEPGEVLQHAFVAMN